MPSRDTLTTSGLRPIASPGQPRPMPIRIARAVDETDPSAFLHAMAGGVRGFWGRGDRWVTWGGALADLSVTGPGLGRFEAIRGDLLSAVGGTVEEWRALAPEERPRAFGGFSFLDEETGNGVWGGFPRARFILPRMFLARGGDGVRLVAQGRPGEEAELEARLEEVETRLEELRGREVGIPPDPRSLPNGSSGDALGWSEAVRGILDALDDDGLSKVVLARTRDVRLPAVARPSRVLRFLRHENRMAHVFLVEPEPGRIFLGAAPEILVELRERRFEATAVAGSMPRGADDAQDRALARRLLESAKDRMEHELTADEMTEVLGSRLERMEVETAPHVLTLARIQHLETVIRGDALPGEDVLSLVEALHPTPAVCGRPRDEALVLIRDCEHFDRGWYAGPVGWIDPAGDGDFVPGLRSAVGSGAQWRLFAGAGIVRGSDPAAEWDETALKLEPALRALTAGLSE